VHLGLRGRLIAVLAAVSALTLAVVAVTLLSPLDQRLRSNALESLTGDLANQRGLVTALPAGSAEPGDRRLHQAVRLLRRRMGADIAVFAADGRQLATTDRDRTRRSPAATTTLRTRRPAQLITGEGATMQAEAAMPISLAGHAAVLSAQRRIDDIQDTSAVVSRAFVVAAVAGLGGALLAGLLLAGRLARRLRHLRDTALRVAQIGPAAELQPDTSRDEIGDLSRAFATMQQRLREQEQARRSFVATASHELRTPLTSLRMMLDMLIDDLDARPADVASARTQAANADRQADRLSQLAADLLDLSRIDAGAPLRVELVELDAVACSVIAELDVRLAGDPRRVVLDADAGRWAVGDPGGVAQILRILLDNAVHHGEGGIRVAVQDRNGVAGVVVQDDGPGVPPEDRERIFERFARGTQAAPGGFGLGLAIARELARGMDGDVAIEDGVTGAGFALTLPSAPAP
jgi:signal transduction histidine kinase